MIPVAANTIVSFRYVMKNSKGDVLENTMEADPTSYLHGSTGIQPLLQQQLEGLRRGDKIKVSLPAASGLTSEDFVFDVIIDDVAMASEEEILLGYPVQVTAEKCDADCDCYHR